jgi:hypothetical protein
MLGPESKEYQSPFPERHFSKSDLVAEFTFTEQPT